MSDVIDWLNRTPWMDGCDLEVEIDQARDEGRDLGELTSTFDELLSIPKPAGEWYVKFGEGRDRQWLERAAKLMDDVQRRPIDAEQSASEPSDLESIRRARPTPKRIGRWTGGEAEWLERLHGGLLGRICGCMLGKPVEAWFRHDIEILGRATGNLPIIDYWREATGTEQRAMFDSGETVRTPNERMRGCLKGEMHGSIEDDDINYTTIGFAVVKRYGKNFTPLDVAEFWCQNLPILHTCTAERVAYRNFVANILPPDSAVYRNPYREWIGAQIRADYFGYANPGQPERAAEWAWRDGSISHVKNGIYGEMWVAAMLAAAYVENDWLAIIGAGLREIPAHCRLRNDIGRIVDLYMTGGAFDHAVAAIHAQWDEKKGHHWCHTNSNAQVVTAALLWGEDNFETTITRAVMAAFDTDCNAATCGSLWGIMHGVSRLPSKWTDPIDDIVRTGVAGYHEVKVSKLAEEMLSTAKDALE